jgi:hypothetical protein
VYELKFDQLKRLTRKFIKGKFSDAVSARTVNEKAQRLFESIFL